MSDEIKKPEDAANAPLPEEELEKVVGGASTGKHIKEGTLHVRKNSGDTQAVAPSDSELTPSELDGVTGGKVVAMGPDLWE